jgi:hypothetical protein
VTSGATLTKAKFDASMKSIYQAGGANNTLQAYLSPTNFMKLSGFYDSFATIANVASLSYNINKDMSSNVVGSPPVTIIRTPFGDVEPVLDRWAIDTVIPIIDPSKAGWITFDPYTRKKLSVDGDYMKEEIVGEFGFCLKQEAAHALMTGVS